MKLYSGKIPIIAEEVVRTLADAGDIEVNDRKEAQLDVESVLKEYLRTDRELTDKAKDVMEQRKLPYEQLQKIKRGLADERDFAVGDESINWITTQVVESFMQSQWVDEVYADDQTLRRKLRDVLRRHMDVDASLDAEVRQRIKNLTEGTSTWDIEYARVMEQVKRKHHME